MSTVTIVLDLVRAREKDRLRRRIEIAVVVSLMLHAIALYEWFPREPLLLPGEGTTKPEPALVARLAQPTPRAAAPPATAASPSQPPPVAQRETPPPVARPRPPRRPPPKRAPPPVMTTPEPAPLAVAPAPELAPAPPSEATAPSPPVTPAPRIVTPAPPLTGDLSSYIRQQRAARGEASDLPSAPESETARRDRIVAENLATLNTSAVANAPQNGGGTFQIRRMDYADAQFTFYGWNRAINRRLFQVIDVDRGANPTINIAIVRKIIAIIRDYEPGEFRWHSKRLGRDLMLSARPEDTSELEAFMMKEFFTDSMQPR